MCKLSLYCQAYSLKRKQLKYENEKLSKTILIKILFCFVFLLIIINPTGSCDVTLNEVTFLKMTSHMPEGPLVALVVVIRIVALDIVYRSRDGTRTKVDKSVYDTSSHKLIRR